MFLISVIIVTYNSESVIFDCLDSLFEYNDLGNGLEIIVIDNSDDEISKRMSNNFIERYKNNVKYKRSGGNVGFGAANNIGAEMATGKIILFLNPDTILIEPIFLKAIDCFNDSRVATLGIQMVDEKRDNQISFFFIRGYFTPFLNLFVKFFNKINFKLNNMITSGACLFVSKNIFNKVGGFSKDMFLYHEESFLARKICNLSEGYRFSYLPNIKYIHLEKKVKMSTFLLNEHYNSLFYYYKYFGYNLKLVKYLSLQLLNFKGSLAYILNLKNKYKQIDIEKEVFKNIVND